jgi:hypothetical protein
MNVGSGPFSGSGARRFPHFPSLIRWRPALGLDPKLGEKPGPGSSAGPVTCRWALIQSAGVSRGLPPDSLESNHS